jgi:hypothetical protein
VINTAPVRLQLSRHKGFNLQEHSRAINGLEAVNVARPGKWGNPFDFRRSEYCWAALSFECRGDAKGRREASIKAFCDWIDPPCNKLMIEYELQAGMECGRKKISLGPLIHAGQAPSKDEIVGALRGKNLACFCDLNSLCHADILLRMANK